MLRNDFCYDGAALTFATRRLVLRLKTVMMTNFYTTTFCGVKQPSYAALISYSVFSVKKDTFTLYFNLIFIMLAKAIFSLSHFLHITISLDPVIITQVFVERTIYLELSPFC